MDLVNNDKYIVSFNKNLMSKVKIIGYVYKILKYCKKTCIISLFIVS